MGWGVLSCLDFMPAWHAEVRHFCNLVFIQAVRFCFFIGSAALLLLKYMTFWPCSICDCTSFSPGSATNGGRRIRVAVECAGIWCQHLRKNSRSFPTCRNRSTALCAVGLHVEVAHETQKVWMTWIMQYRNVSITGWHHGM